MFRIFVVIFIFSVCAGCLTKIDFKGSNQATVISGVLSNSEGERSIFISRSEGVEAEKVLLNARGTIYKDGIPEVELVQKEEGELSLPSDFMIQEGATYFVEVVTSDNQVYQSTPQRVPTKYRTDSLSFDVFARQITDEDGNLVDQFYVDFFAHIKLPNPQDTAFYKWQVDQSWNFVSQALTCYKSSDVKENDIFLLSSEGKSAGMFKIQLASMELDQRFWYKFYFNAYLHTIDRNTYTFYEKVQRLAKNQGNLYDEIPAPFKGNTFLFSGNEEIVLGNIEFSLADTMRFGVDSFMMNTHLNILRICEDKMDCNYPCYYPCALPCECRDCRFAGGGEYYGEKPDYFVD